MRELTMDEVTLVTGGYTAGVDGPSNDSSWLGLIEAGAKGGAAGNVAANAIAVQYGSRLGLTPAMISTGVLRATGYGAAVSVGWYAGQWAGDSINSFNLQHSGMSLGEAIYRTVGN